jgi:hypothetical protein
MNVKLTDVVPCTFLVLFGVTLKLMFSKMKGLYLRPDWEHLSAHTAFECCLVAENFTASLESYLT